VEANDLRCRVALNSLPVHWLLRHMGSLVRAARSLQQSLLCSAAQSVWPIVLSEQPDKFSAGASVQLKASRPIVAAKTRYDWRPVVSSDES
jgi:hypothetical protein